MRVFALCLIVALSGCTASYFKDGATQHDFDVDKAACTAASYQSAPPVMSARPLGSTYNDPFNVNCLGGFGSVNCMSIGGGYVPPAPMPVDINGGARLALFDSCMTGKGWSKTKPADGPANPSNSGEHSE